jgi:hypothetical protein
MASVGSSAFWTTEADAVVAPSAGHARRTDDPLARLAVRPHNGMMDIPKPQAFFEPIETKTGEWCVRLSLPGGREPVIDGFKSETEAREWIKTDSMAWIERYEAGRYV